MEQKIEARLICSFCGAPAQHTVSKIGKGISILFFCTKHLKEIEGVK